ncbi:polyphosphate polymerase domain-containing protein [Pseudodesulfovibrio piezophilus]|uniref:VTC domain-containing protein n=1 Tax=Pseudodesulfovibrio piezophilus (strain DSM 21447 / JCM 15486 / C1TLV30) TaxID=1322246 RepID=M1WJT3_PSEP2|nr:polyphosphate polymerase domain-containing protein [Pseudodesulfovibrio piezophilus]CCH48446.1 conserved protein of unknown function [Pseudodesulfovibrio piezophilus C1TLV30]
MIDATDGTSSYRYERKFTIPLPAVRNLASILRTSRFGFREIYSTRYVNNIYYDTPLFKFYGENMEGLSERKKIRIRWYGASELPSACRFEIKHKKGLVGFKDVVPATCAFNSSCGMPSLINVTVPDKFLHETVGLFPTLMNRYQRRYFLSMDGKFRATIDYELSYSHPSTAHRGGIGYFDNEAVLELKYDHEFDMDAAQVSKEIPFSFSKKSKYVTGVNIVYGC